MKKLPAIPNLLLKLFLDEDNYSEKSGDFTEIYNILIDEGRKMFALLWTFTQTLKTILAFYKDKISWGGDMFKNYMLIAIRNLFKQKVFSLINIFGLAIGITSCLLIALFVKSELSVDSYHENIDRIYHTGQWFNFSGKENIWSASNALTATVLAKEYPQVEKAARVRSMGAVMIRQGDKLFTENNLMYADPEIFDILTLPLLSGGRNDLLVAPYTMVISQEMADKYFGTQNPVGKTLKFNNENEFTIQGVMKDIPENSLRDPDAICSMQTFISEQPQNSPVITDWNSYNFRTILLLAKGADPQEVQREMNAGFHRYADEGMATMGMKSNFLLKPYDEVYLEPFGSTNPPIVYVYIFSIVAIAILLIACINFMNLSTAQSASRAKEVGIRKVLGSEKKKLITQFLSESIIVSFIALGFSIILAWLTLPLLNSVVIFKLSLWMLAEADLVIYLILFTIFVGLLAGLYPAFYLSSFQPVSVLKGKLKSGATNSGLRKVLVVGQFTVSIILIIGSAVIFQQLDFLKSKDPGFNKEQALLFSLPANSDPAFLEIIRSELLSSSQIKNVSASSQLPGDGAAANAVIPEGFTEETTQAVDEFNVDRDFIKTMGMEIVKGRDFSIEHGEFEPNSVIINEAAVKKFGWDDPIGKTIKTYDPYTENRWRDVYVVGVVKDFHLRPVVEKIHPVFITCDRNLPYGFSKLSNVIVRISPDNLSETISFIENEWTKLLPEIPFAYRFMDDVFDLQFRRVERAQKVVGFFTTLTVLVACLGLFGLISYLTEQRTKEIGIRKALGASFHKLILFLLRDFTKWILFANLIALPVSYWVATKILSGFAYRIELGISLFILSGLAVFIVGLSTILFKVIKAASLNPVVTLKYE